MNGDNEVIANRFFIFNNDKHGNNDVDKSFEAMATADINSVPNLNAASISSSFRVPTPGMQSISPRRTELKSPNTSNFDGMPDTSPLLDLGGFSETPKSKLTTTSKYMKWRLRLAVDFHISSVY